MSGVHISGPLGLDLPHDVPAEDILGVLGGTLVVWIGLGSDINWTASGQGANRGIQGKSRVRETVPLAG